VRSPSAAGLFVAAGLLALAAAPPGPPAAPCVAPGELAARDGHTRAVACRPEHARGPVRGPARRLFGLRIDPNTADATTLASLPGIGPVRAAALLSERCLRPFAAPADLARVRGIGPRTLARLLPELAVRPGGEPRCDLH
jgi:competence protein ComEA